jgi:type I restriction enzyme S subunit
MEKELPKGWFETTVGECFHEVINGTTINQNKVDVGIPVSRIETIQKSLFDLKRIQHIEYDTLTQEQVDKFKYQIGDIAFSHINSMEHVGKVALYEGTPKVFIHGMNLLRLRLGHRYIMPKFVYYQMLSNSFREEVRSRVGQAVNQVSINQKNLSEVPLVVAPFAEQQRIVAKLDTILARINNCKIRLDNIPALLKNFRQGVLAAAVSGDLTKEWRTKNESPSSSEKLLEKVLQEHYEYDFKIAKGKKNFDKKRFDKEYLHDKIIENSDLEVPNSWTWAQAETITVPGRSITYGIIKPGAHIENGVPYVRVMEMKTGTIDIHTLKKCDPVRAAKFKKASLKSGDLLISKDGTIGKVAIVPPELEGGNITQHVLRFSVNKLISNKYVAIAIQSDFFQKKIKEYVLGVALQGINVGDFKLLPLPIPSTEEQKEIVRKVEELFHFADTIEARYQKAKAWFDKLPQSILSKAFRGQLVPQNPTDEPASVLLERIKKEKQQTTKPKTKTTSKTKKLYQENDKVSMVAEG